MNLYQASCWYFERSQAALKRSLWLSFALLALTLVALAPMSDIEDAVLILAIAALQLWQMWSKYRALYWFSKGDQPRRMFQLQSGLGIRPSAEKCACIEEEVGVCEHPIDGDYWVSKKVAGPIRMMEMLLESSFYTRTLASKCRNFFLAVGTVGIAVSATALVFAYRLRQGHSENDLIAHIVLTVFVFFLTGDFWVVSLLYNDLYKSADLSHKRAFQLLQEQSVDPDQALEATMDYNTAVVQAPPLLTSKHMRSKTQLDILFKRNFGKLLGISSEPEGQA